MTRAKRSKIDIGEAMRLARAAVEAAGRAASEVAARAGGPAQRVKDDGSLVTEADLAAERAILEVIGEAPFAAGVLTEEQGQVVAGAETRWIVDPLDGTHRFTRRHRFWGPLVALEHDGDVVAAAMAMPVVGEVYWSGKGLGAFCNGRPVRVSNVDVWRQAILCLGSVPRLLHAPGAAGVMELARTCEYVCAGGDLSGAALVFCGQAEAWIETGVKRWDVAPMSLFVTEAGGRATDLTEWPAFGEGESLLISNGRVHEHVLGALRAAP